MENYIVTPLESRVCLTPLQSRSVLQDEIDAIRTAKNPIKISLRFMGTKVFKIKRWVLDLSVST